MQMEDKDVTQIVQEEMQLPCLCKFEYMLVPSEKQIRRTLIAQLHEAYCVVCDIYWRASCSYVPSQPSLEYCSTII